MSPLIITGKFAAMLGRAWRALSCLLRGDADGFVRITTYSYHKRVPGRLKLLLPRSLRIAYARTRARGRLVPEPVRYHARRPHSRLVLHVGLPKTGTTFLQKRVFNQQWSVPYFGVHSRVVHPLDANLKQMFRYGTPQEWASFRELSPDEVTAAAASLPYRARDTLICSNENYFTSTTDIAHAGRELEPGRVTAHLREFRRSFWKGGEVRVLIGIRRQDHWLASNYAEQAFRRELSGQWDFEKKVSRLIGPKGCRVPWLDYAHLVSTISDAIGRENVEVLLMEELLADPASVLAQIEAFVGYSMREINVADFERKENVKAVTENCWRLNERPVRKPHLLQKLEASSTAREQTVMLSDALSERIMASCHAANERLAVFLDRDLSRFGYLDAEPMRFDR